MNSTLEGYTLIALANAQDRAEEASQRREGEDAAIAALFEAEDTVLAMDSPGLPVRMAQADIALRRRAIAAETPEEAEELEAIRDTILAAADAIAGAMVTPAGDARRALRPRC